MEPDYKSWPSWKAYNERSEGRLFTSETLPSCPVIQDALMIICLPQTWEFVEFLCNLYCRSGNHDDASALFAHLFLYGPARNSETFEFLNKAARDAMLSLLIRPFEAHAMADESRIAIMCMLSPILTRVKPSLAAVESAVKHMRATVVIDTDPLRAPSSVDSASTSSTAGSDVPSDPVERTTLQKSSSYRCSCCNSAQGSIRTCGKGFHKCLWSGAGNARHIEYQKLRACSPPCGVASSSESVTTGFSAFTITSSDVQVERAVARATLGSRHHF